MHTKNEIENQFTTWFELESVIKNHQNLVDEIITYIKDEDAQVIFTGAGTSGFVGDYLVPFLNQGNNRNRYVSCYSTNIVGNPKLNLGHKNIVLVSFARSGNSPESVEAVELCNQYASKVKHLIISCNENGALAKTYPENSIILPKETNDLGFAMTNSFSSMLITAALIFGIEFDVNEIIPEAKQLYERFNYEILKDPLIENIVILSDGQYVGLSNELKLKFMELSNGNLGYYNEQFLNFRHGPKSVITKKSLIFHLNSEEAIRSKYELDLIDEMLADTNEPSLICFGPVLNTSVVNYEVSATDFAYGLVVLPTLQRCAVELSLSLGIDPDNPSPSGSVNRVVQGVKIHKRGELCE